MSRSSNRNQLINERRNARGFFTDRYALAVAVVEVFFRKNIGERYFNFWVFFFAFLGLLALRFWVAFGNFWSFTGYDVFLAAYLVLGFSHLATQKRLASQGQRIHSWYIGDSRFAFLGKYINSKNPDFAAYVYIEPLVIFLLVLPVLTYSILLAIGLVVTGARMWYQSYRTVKNYRHEEMDMEDSKQEAEHRSRTFEEPAPVQLSSPPPIPKMTNKPVPPPIPLVDDDDELTPMEALKRLNQNRKETDKTEE